MDHHPKWKWFEDLKYFKCPVIHCQSARGFVVAQSCDEFWPCFGNKQLQCGNRHPKKCHGIKCFAISSGKLCKNRILVFHIRFLVRIQTGTSALQVQIERQRRSNGQGKACFGRINRPNPKQTEQVSSHAHQLFNLFPSILSISIRYLYYPCPSVFKSSKHDSFPSPPLHETINYHLHQHVYSHSCQQNSGGCTAQWFRNSSHRSLS